MITDGTAYEQVRALIQKLEDALPQADSVVADASSSEDAKLVALIIDDAIASLGDILVLLRLGK